MNMSELEKAAEEWLFESEEHNNQLSFIKGAEWQQDVDKGKYTQEEVLALFDSFKMYLPFNYEFLIKEKLKIK